MKNYRIETRIRRDGLLTIKGLPFQTGERVQVIVRRQQAAPGTDDRHPYGEGLSDTPIHLIVSPKKIGVFRDRISARFAQTVATKAVSFMITIGLCVGLLGCAMGNPGKEESKTKPTGSHVTATHESESLPSVPLKSSFVVTGTYGCVAPINYDLRIQQAADHVTYSVKGKEHDVNWDAFLMFWSVLSEHGIERLDASCGREKTTADFHGSLSIDVITDGGTIHKQISLTYERFEDKGFRYLWALLLNMVDEADRRPPFDSPR